MRRIFFGKRVLIVGVFFSGLLGLSLPEAARAGTITTVAGGGTSLGDGSPAMSAQLICPKDVAMDPLGNLYIADPCSQRIRKVDIKSGLISTVAGTGKGGFSGDGGLAPKAQVSNPKSIAIDLLGNLYVAELGKNDRIRKIDASSGKIGTLAGGETSVLGSTQK